jgi:hypothetical protein
MAGVLMVGKSLEHIFQMPILAAVLQVVVSALLSDWRLLLLVQKLMAAFSVHQVQTILLA